MSKAFYRKNPVVIEAIQLTQHTVDEYNPENDYNAAAKKLGW